MKVIVKFSQDIGQTSLQKEVSPNETVQNLQILISLNYEGMKDCKLVYKGKTLNDKNQVLRELMDANESNQVTVMSKGELQVYAEQVGSLVSLFNQYPIYFVGGLVTLIFLVLYVLGQAS